MKNLNVLISDEAGIKLAKIMEKNNLKNQAQALDFVIHVVFEAQIAEAIHK